MADERAVVSRGGKPDLAGLESVRAPTLVELAAGWFGRYLRV